MLNDYHNITVPSFSLTNIADVLDIERRKKKDHVSKIVGQDGKNGLEKERAKTFGMRKAEVKSGTAEALPV